MNPRPVALISALLPFITVQLTYLMAASQGSVPWCFPYLESCTSISATGRDAPASFLFRAGMIPTAVFMLGYWWLNRVWLLQTAAAGPGRRLHWMLCLGGLACAGLVLYVTVLGEVGKAYQYQRRAGTVLFFSFTFLSQLLLAAELRRQGPGRCGVTSRWPGLMLANCVLMLLLGLMTIILDAWNEAWYDTIEDSFEWVLALLLQSNFLFGYLAWREAGWHLQVEQATP